jgi:hypothetical protein
MLLADSRGEFTKRTFARTGWDVQAERRNARFVGDVIYQDLDKAIGQVNLVGDEPPPRELGTGPVSEAEMEGAVGHTRGVGYPNDPRLCIEEGQPGPISRATNLDVRVT